MKIAAICNNVELQVQPNTISVKLTPSKIFDEFMENTMFYQGPFDSSLGPVEARPISKVFEQFMEDVLFSDYQSSVK